mmetsp:Transcript_51319/g.62765  ORF Transcript_51319/g.62765 Transcript_51319/m.62765 type:complete len:90 (-) Transcript_51319:8-277(-)
MDTGKSCASSIDDSMGVSMAMALLWTPVASNVANAAALKGPTKATVACCTATTATKAASNTPSFERRTTIIPRVRGKFLFLGLAEAGNT